MQYRIQRKFIEAWQVIEAVRFPCTLLYPHEWNVFFTNNGHPTRTCRLGPPPPNFKTQLFQQPTMKSIISDTKEIWIKLSSEIPACIQSRKRRKVRPLHFNEQLIASAFCGSFLKGAIMQKQRTLKCDYNIIHTFHSNRATSGQWTFLFLSRAGIIKDELPYE